MSTSWSDLSGLMGRRVSWIDSDDETRSGEIVGYREHISKGLLLIVVALPLGRPADGGLIWEVPLNTALLRVKRL